MILVLQKKLDLYILINDKKRCIIFLTEVSMTDLDYSNIRKNCEICNTVFSVERHEPSDPLEGYFCHRCGRWVCSDCTCFNETDAYSSVCKKCCACNLNVCGEDSDNPEKSYVKAEDFFCYKDDKLVRFGRKLNKYVIIALSIGVAALWVAIYVLFL